LDDLSVVDESHIARAVALRGSENSTRLAA
ncbi:MAG: hypothetical protein RL085_822, partial [Actinomycetota bacterium]